MILKTRDVSETRCPTLRQTESVKHHHAFIQREGARAYYCSNPDPFAVVQQDRNGHEHAGEERPHTTDPEVAIRRSGEEDESRAEHGAYNVVFG